MVSQFEPRPPIGIPIFVWWIRIALDGKAATSFSLWQRKMMRRVLVDHARRHKAIKRGGSTPKISLEQAVALAEEQSGNLLVLDGLLTRLAAIDPQEVRIIELRFFGGLCCRGDRRGNGHLAHHCKARVERREEVASTRNAQDKRQCIRSVEGIRNSQES
jgi:hypothetical protein